MKELLTSQVFVGLLQAAGVGALFLLAALGQRIGFRKETTPPPSKDVIVPSVTVADRVALEHLADTLRDSNRIAQTHREHDTEILYTLVAIKENGQRIENILQRLLDFQRRP
jgi:hypothetical protein